MKTGYYILLEEETRIAWVNEIDGILLNYILLEEETRIAWVNGVDGILLNYILLEEETRIALAECKDDAIICIEIYIMC